MAATKLRWVVFVLTLIGAAVLVTQRFVVETDLFAFLPEQGVARELNLTRNILQGPLRRALVLNIVYDESAAAASTENEPATRAYAEGAQAEQAKAEKLKLRDAAAATARALAQELSTTPGITEVSVAPSEEFQSAIYDLYFPRRFALYPASSGVATRPSAEEFWTEPELRKRLAHSKQFLASPAAALYRPLFTKDPLLLFETQVERLRSLQPAGVSLDGGQFMTRGAAIVFAETRDGLSSEQRSQLLSTLHAAFARHKQAPSLKLEMSGTLPFEVEGEAITRRDIERVSTISMVAVVALCLLFFRSLLPLLVVVLPVASGLLLGTASCLLLFGKIHGLTLAFGAALIGVSIDYPLHLLNDQAHAGDSPQKALRRVQKGLYVGCATTTTGFLTFFLTSSPALLQVAVVASVGLVTALLVSTQILPTLPLRVGNGAMQRRLVLTMDRLLARASRFRFAARVTLLGLVALLGLGVWRLHWQVSTDALNPTSRQLREADEAVRNRMQLNGPQIVTEGKDSEEVLERTLQLSDRLSMAKASGVISNYAAVTELLLPRGVQEQNSKAAAGKDAALALRRALEAEGFSSEAFEEAIEAQKQPISPLTQKLLQTSPLRDAIAPLLIDSEHGMVSLTRLEASNEAASQLASELEHSFVYQPQAFIEQALGTLAGSLRRVILWGAACMFVIVFLRHRKLRPTAIAFLPAILAALGSLVLVGAVSGPLHLFHALAALVVLSMGIDYGTFLVEAQTGDENHAAPWPSIVGAALSTIASMGTLGLSSVPALQALGSVIGLGIVLAVMLCPLIQIALGASSAPRPSRHAAQKRLSALSLLAPLSLLPLFLGALSGCTSQPAAESPDTQPVAPPALTEAEVRQALLVPAELPHLFWRQQIKVRYGEKKFQLDAVLQNDGEEFDVLALGPAQTRVFLIKQVDHEVDLQVFVDREINLAPEWLLFDLQRALFFNASETSLAPGKHQHEIHQFCVTDTWTSDGIDTRIISDEAKGCSSESAESGLSIRYRAPWKPGTPPQRVILTHAKRDYSIEVHQTETGDMP